MKWSEQTIPERVATLQREYAVQPEQEPVAWMVTYGGLTHIAYTKPTHVVDTHYQPLYASPPHRNQNSHHARGL